MKQFIIFTDEELEDIKSGKVVTVEIDSNDIFCVSEDWMKQYDSMENLP